MAMNVTVPASAVFFHYVIIESINVLLVLVEFIKLIICHIIFNGNNFSKNVVALFQYGNRHSTVDECTAFFIKIEDRFHHFKLFFHWYAGVFCVKSVLLEEARRMTLAISNVSFWSSGRTSLPISLTISIRELS